MNSSDRPMHHTEVDPEALAEARRNVLDGTPDGYRTVGEPEPGLFPDDMPPIMVIENYRTHPSIDRFTALIRYIGLPDPVAVIVGSVDLQSKTPRDVFGVLTFPGMPETDGCKVLLDDEDDPMCILHASNCIRSKIIRSALISQAHPSSFGPCDLDDLVNSNDPEKLAMVPVATAPAFDKQVQEDVALLRGGIEELAETFAEILEGIDTDDPEALRKLMGTVTPDMLEKIAEKLESRNEETTDGGTN